MILMYSWHSNMFVEYKYMLVYSAIEFHRMAPDIDKAFCPEAVLQDAGCIYCMKNKRASNHRLFLQHIVYEDNCFPSYKHQKDDVFLYVGAVSLVSRYSLNKFNPFESLNNTSVMIS